MQIDWNALVVALLFAPVFGAVCAAVIGPLGSLVGFEVGKGWRGWVGRFLWFLPLSIWFAVAPVFGLGLSHVKSPIDLVVSTVVMAAGVALLSLLLLAFPATRRLVLYGMQGDGPLEPPSRNWFR